MGKDFGNDVRKAIQDGGRQADPAAAAAGQSAGGKFGDGFNTGTDSKLKATKARFASAGNDAGNAFSLGAGNGLNKLAANVWSVQTLGTALKQVVAPAMLATKAIGVAGAAGAAVALGGAAIGVVGALSQVAGVAPLVVTGMGALFAVMGTVKLATMGVSQAFKDQAAAAGGSAAAQKKLAADMKDLAPNAQTFVKSVLAIKPAFDALQKGVQNNFFAGTAAQVKSLALTFLPQLRSGLGAIATSVNGLGKGALSGLQSSLGGGGLRTMLLQIASALHALTPAVAPVVGAFARIGETSAKYFTPLAGTIADLGKKFAAFIQQAANSGKLDSFIQGGIHAFQTLLSIVLNIGGGIGHILTAAAPLGGSLLGKLDLVSAAFKTITGGTSNQKELTSFFTGLQPVLGTLGKLLGTVVKALEPLLPIVVQVAQVLGSKLIGVVKDLSPGLAAFGQIILGLAGPLGTIVQAVAGGLSAALVSLVPLIKPVAGAFTALAPVIGALVSNILTPFPPLLADVAKAVQILAPAFTPLIGILGTLINSALSALAPVLGIVAHLLSGLLLDAVKTLTPILPGIVLAFTQFGQVLAGSLAPLLPPLVKSFGLLLTAFLPMVAPLVNILTVLTPLAAIFLQFVANLLPPLIKFLTPLAPIIVAVAAAWALWNLAMDANPIVLIGLAIAGLIVGIVELVKHFNVITDFFTKTLPAVFTTVVNWIKNSVPDWLKPFIPFLGLPILIKEHWSAIVASLSAIFSAIKGGFETAFSAIAAAAKASWTAITAIFNVGLKVLEVAGKIVFAIVVGPFILAFDALRKVAEVFWGWIGPYVTAAVHAIGSAISSAMHAVRTAWTAAWDAVKSAAVSIWRAISGFFTAAWHDFTAFLRAEWQGWVNIAHAIWGTIGGPVMAVWRALSGWFSAAWGSFKAFVSSAWTHIVGALTSAWNAVTGPIKSTWNKLSSWFASTWDAFKSFVGSAWGHIVGKITGAFDGVAGAISSAWDGIKAAFVSPINWIITKVIDPFLDAIHKIPGVPQWHVNPISTSGGGGGGGGGGGQIKRPTPGFARGGTMGPGGMFWTGEQGPELGETLPGGGVRIYSNRESLRMTGGRGPGQSGHPGYFLGGVISGIKDLGNYAWEGAKATGHEARQLGGVAVGGIVRGAEKAANAAVGVVPGGPLFTGLADGIMGKVADGAENFIKGKAAKKQTPAKGKGGTGDMSAHSATAAAAQAYARTLLASHGWGAGQMAPLISLWNGESGWNNLAANPTSSAFGIAQFLDSTWGSYGPKTTNYKKQVEYGEDYIAGSYGTPSNAFGQWSARSPHWYDDGGWLNPGATMAMNATGRREAVMPEDVMTDTIRRELGATDNGAILTQIRDLLSDISAFTASTAAAGASGGYGGPTY
jgi:phage-related protein